MFTKAARKRRSLDRRLSDGHRTPVTEDLNINEKKMFTKDLKDFKKGFF